MFIALHVIFKNKYLNFTVICYNYCTAVLSIPNAQMCVNVHIKSVRKLRSVEFLFTLCVTAKKDTQIN